FPPVLTFLSHDTAPPAIYTLSLHDALPIYYRGHRIAELPVNHRPREHGRSRYGVERYLRGFLDLLTVSFIGRYRYRPLHLFGGLDRKSTRLNSSHVAISYAVFCLKKKTTNK